MRVIAGNAKGMRLHSPEGYDIRPTSERVKEAIFSIIFEDIEDSIFTDLFAGSGGMGIEAISRGAAKSYFNDSSKKSIELIEKNIERTKFQDKSEVKNYDAVSFLDTIREKLNIIYIDPPYKFDGTRRILQAIVKNDVLSYDGIVILEQGLKDEVLEVEGLTITKDKKYGKTKILIYELSESI